MKATKRVWATLTLAGCSLLAIHCARQENGSVDKLPELPKDLVAGLVPAQTAPVLMTQLTQTPQPRRPPSQAIPNRAQSCDKRYTTYILYPMTVCYPWNELTGALDLKRAKFSPARGSAADEPQGTKYYKLTSYKSRSFRPALFCRTSGGPWYGQVIEQESCYDEASNFIFQILGAPEPLVLSWYGTWQDAPPLVSSNHFAEVETVCSCCPGFKPCHRSCIISNAPCQNGHPF